MWLVNFPRQRSCMALRLSRINNQSTSGFRARSSEDKPGQICTVMPRVAGRETWRLGPLVPPANLTQISSGRVDDAHQSDTYSSVHLSSSLMYPCIPNSRRRLQPPPHKRHSTAVHEARQRVRSEELGLD